MTRYISARLYSCGSDISKPWYIYYSVENPDTGLMVRCKFRGDLNKATTIRERKARAALIMEEINLQLSRGWNPYVVNQIKDKTLQEILTEFLKIKKASLRHRSYQSYKYALDSFLKYLEGQYLIENSPKEITTTIARGWVDSLIVSGLSGMTVNTSKSMVKVFFGMMVDREIIDKNPFRNIPKQAQDQGKNKAFSKKEMEMIWLAMNKKSYGHYIFTRLIYFTYIRPVEILRLKVSDVDMDRSVITISGENSKNRKTQTVAIPDSFKRELAVYLNGSKPSDFFVGQKFKPGVSRMSRNVVSLNMNRVIRDLGFSSDHTLYAFKHSGVVAAYHAGIDLYSISRQLRHHSLVITQIYLKSLGQMPNTEFASKMV